MLSHLHRALQQKFSRGRWRCVLKAPQCFRNNHEENANAGHIYIASNGSEHLHLHNGCCLFQDQVCNYSIPTTGIDGLGCDHLDFSAGTHTSARREHITISKSSVAWSAEFKVSFVLVTLKCQYTQIRKWVFPSRTHIHVLPELLTPFLRPLIYVVLINILQSFQVLRPNVSVTNAQSCIYNTLSLVSSGKMGNQM